MRVKIKVIILAMIIFVTFVGNYGALYVEATLPVENNIQTQDTNLNVEPVNFVDIRYELVALVFRLAGRISHTMTYTEYQQQLQETFGDFSNHSAVVYTRNNLWFGFNFVFNMAIHLQQTDEGFALIDNIDALVDSSSGSVTWTRENASIFVSLLNDFYHDTNFSAFFEEHRSYFEAHSARFYDEVYGSVNREWFVQYGINPDNMRIIISPSCSTSGYASWIWGDTPEDTIVYARLPGGVNYTVFKTLIIHEFVHAFSNYIASVWYEEDEIFREWATASIDLDRMPFYPTGLVMGFEYVTRAYTILYMAENTDANPIFLLLNERANGFPYIFEVYAMITGDEPFELDDDILSVILSGAEFVIDETEFSTISRDRVITWRFLHLQDYELNLDNFIFSHVRNDLNTSTGDILIVNINGAEFLYIDVGLLEGFADNRRLYSVFPL